MWKRSYWVLMTYLKRLSFWAVIAVSVLISITGFLTSNYLIREAEGIVISAESNAISNDAITTLEQLDAVLATDPAKPVELDYGQLYFQATSKTFPEPRGSDFHIGRKETAQIHPTLAAVEKLQHVVAINAGFTIDQATIDRIAKFKTLKRLIFVADLGYETLDLSPLRSLQELEEIQFGVVSRIDSFTPLSDLPKLHTLGFVSTSLIKSKTFDEIAKLKNLRLLSLPNLSLTRGNTDALRSLANSTTLKRINYRVSLDQRDQLRAAQEVVPTIQVVSSLFLPARHIALMFSLIIVMIGALSLSAHLTGQLSIASVHLAPQFRLPHYLVAIFFIATIAILSSSLLWNVGANVVSTLSLIVCYGSGVFWLATRLPTRPDWRLIFAAPLMMMPYAVLPLLWFDPLIVENYLMSGDVLSPLLFLAIAFGFGWQSVRNMEARLRTRMEYGLPAILSFRDFQTYKATLRANQTNESPVNKHDVLVNNLPVIAGWSLAVAVASVVLNAFGYQYYGKMAANLCVLIPISCVISVLMKWWVEMPYFAAGTVRPPARSEHVNQLMYGVAKNFADSSLMIVASLIVLFFANGFNVQNLGQRMMVSVTAVATTTLVVYAAILWMLAIRTFFGVAVLAFITYLVVLLMGLHIVMKGHDWDYFESPLSMLLSGCVASTIAIIAIIFARRYLMRIEWARFV